MLCKFGRATASSRHPLLPRFLLILLPLVSNCAGPEAKPFSPNRTFLCANGVTFRTEASDKGIRVITSEAIYELSFGRSSIGRKFASDSVTLIIDEDSAVLAGVEKGAFRDCHER